MKAVNFLASPLSASFVDLRSFKIVAACSAVCVARGGNYATQRCIFNVRI